LQDLKFVEESNWIYTVSKDGLLSLFDYKTQQFVWKNKLTLSRSGMQDALQQQELFQFGYLSRNLMVHSQRRAMLVNTAGHANFEIDFATIFGEAATKEGSLLPIARIFDNESHIYTCFAFGNKVVVYKDAQY
jgi:hypothetical protein